MKIQRDYMKEHQKIQREAKALQMEMDIRKRKEMLKKAALQKKDKNDLMLAAQYRAQLLLERDLLKKEKAALKKEQEVAMMHRLEKYMKKQQKTDELAQSMKSMEKHKKIVKHSVIPTAPRVPVYDRVPDYKVVAPKPTWFQGSREEGKRCIHAPTKEDCEKDDICAWTGSMCLQDI
jgi:hypothetical protein